VTTRLEVGRIGRAHGLNGEVAVTFTSNRDERHAVGSELFAGERRLVVESVRPHQQRWLIRFAGIDDRDAAEELRGVLLTAEPLGELGADEAWAHDLIGCEVRDTSDTWCGEVVALEANPAGDLLVLDTGGLVPMQFVLDHVDGVVRIDPPEGLLS
jgi:16S rRNA processing protein RimM